MDGVVYLLHFQNEGRSCTNQNDEELIRKPDRGIDEFCFIYSDASRQKYVAAHEMCHLYGAADFYDSDYFSSTYSDDIMNTKSEKIGPVTAFSIGWLDRLDKSVWNTAWDKLWGN